MSNEEKDILHRHIQLSVFGRQRETAEKFDELQEKLHELVDNCNGGGLWISGSSESNSKLQLLRDFVERVHARASVEGQKYKLAIDAELKAMAEES